VRRARGPWQGRRRPVVRHEAGPQPVGCRQDAQRRQAGRRQGSGHAEPGRGVDADLVQRQRHHGHRRRRQGRPGHQ
ncbi:hypothetical protein PHISP_08850, partial [Aspergillus sp. HF37]